MSLDLFQQLDALLKKSKNVLILLPQNPSGDLIGSGWAFYFFLKNRGIESTIAFNDEFGEAKKFDFLEKPENISNNILGSRDFVIQFGTQFNKIIDVRTEFGSEEVKIFITPEKGSIDPRDFSFVPAQFKFDLVVVLGASDKESIGKIYEENPDIFFEIPVVNIDCHINNESFGQINFVNATASSVSEILFELLEKIDPDSIDERLANCLLAGIISSTESFQRKNTTPKCLQIASKLMDKGADQQKIVRWLYKTQPFNLLKLWGRVMARLNWDEKMKLAWSLVGLEDFVQSRSKPTDIPFILDKIRDNYSSGNIFAILFNEKADSVVAMIKSNQLEVLKAINFLFPQGKIQGDILIIQEEGKNILEMEKELLEKVGKI
jgi:nanoRNase/pAp phosphatase (c-di-AMP/oligoRNAs hydrolase)